MDERKEYIYIYIYQEGKMNWIYSHWVGNSVLGFHCHLDTKKGRAHLSFPTFTNVKIGRLDSQEVPLLVWLPRILSLGVNWKGHQQRRECCIMKDGLVRYYNVIYNAQHLIKLFYRTFGQLWQSLMSIILVFKQPR